MNAYTYIYEIIAGSLVKTLMLEKIESKRRRGQQRMRWLDDFTKSNKHELGQTLGVRERQGGLACFVHWVTELDTT